MSILDDFRWTFNLKTSQVLIKWIQKYCLQRTDYLFRQDECIYVSFSAKSSWYCKMLLHHLSKGACPELCVLLQVYIQSCLHKCRTLLFRYLE